MLILTRKLGEAVVIADRLVLTVVEIQPERARLRIARVNPGKEQTELWLAYEHYLPLAPDVECVIVKILIDRIRIGFAADATTKISRKELYDVLSVNDPPAAKAEADGDAVEVEIMRIVAEHFEVEVGALRRETRFIEDLNADSLDAAELILEIEDRFGVAIPDEVPAAWRTIGDVLRHFRDRGPGSAGVRARLPFDPPPREGRVSLDPPRPEERG